MSLNFFTMTLFCMAMEKHREQVTDTALPQWIVRSFRPLAWLGLAITFYISADLYGWSIGPAVFFGALSAALLCLILLLTYQARLVLSVALVLPLFAYLHFIF